MSSNILEFQKALIVDNKAIFSIETSELNPKKEKTDEIERTKEEFDLVKYTIKTLREYILKYSSTIAEVNTLIQGEIKEGKVILTILKIK